MILEDQSCICFIKVIEIVAANSLNNYNRLSCSLKRDLLDTFLLKKKPHQFSISDYYCNELICCVKIYRLS